MDARLNGGVAQLGEHLPCKQGVESSNLLVSTKAMRSGFPANPTLNCFKQTEMFAQHKSCLYLENRIPNQRINQTMRDMEGGKKWKPEIFHGDRDKTSKSNKQARGDALLR